MTPRKAPSQTLYRVRRYRRDGTWADTRIVAQQPAAERLAARWQAWPSTGSTTVDVTVAPVDWRPL